MQQEILNRVKTQQFRWQRLTSQLDTIRVNLEEANKMMDRVLKEQNILERATVACKQARPLLSAASIKQCEQLANSCIASVFELPYTVEYDVESCRFKLNKGDYITDLADAEGGGIATVIGFIFNVYLIVKLQKRRLLFYDEAFYAVSDKYFSNFIEFIRILCKDLGCEICLITHDERIQPDMVDHVIRIEDGRSKRVK